MSKSEDTAVKTHSGALSVTIPLLFEDNMPPKLIIWDDGGDQAEDVEDLENAPPPRGEIKQQVSMGFVLRDGTA